MLVPGVTLNGRYQLTRRIAAGGMGEVWRARDAMLQREVAVKVLLPALMEDAEFIARFRTEARLMAALRHPGIVQVHDYGENATDGTDRFDFLVMEFIEGTPLTKRIQQAGRLGAAETMTIVAQVADALQAAHEAGIVHRDVKPSNLLVRPGGAIVLIDFGVARSAGISGITSTNVVMGSAHYMAPEQAEGQPVTAVTDVYALGAVAFACLAGRPPYVGDNPLAVLGQLVHGRPPVLPDEVPAPAGAVVMRALARDPGQRFPSAAALAEAARDAAAGRPVAPAPAASLSAASSSAAPVEPASAAPAPGRRRRTALIAAASAAVLALAGAGLVLADRPENAPEQRPVVLPTVPPLALEEDAVVSDPQQSMPAAPRRSGASPAAAGGVRSVAPGASTSPAVEPAPGTSTSAAPTSGPPEPAPASSSPATTVQKNPYKPAKLCGSGFKVIDSAALESGAEVLARVSLLHQASSGRNCVVTLKLTEIGANAAMSAYLQVEGESAVADSGSFAYYAGPVRAPADATCVKWGGSVGDLSFDSPFEHCG